MKTEKNNKLDLLSFQKTLNAQFLEIFEKKATQESTGVIETDQLGLVDNIMGYTFFFPLKDLKSISSENKFENLPLTHNWIAGFNQIRGDVFTIIDFHSLLKYLLNKEIKTELRNLTIDSNVLYLKDQSLGKTGFIIDSLLMKHTEQVFSVFKYSYIDKKHSWKIDDYLIKKFAENNGSILSIINKNLLSEDEFYILNTLYEKFTNNSSYTDAELELLCETTNDHMKIIWLMISDVMFDINTTKPIFVIDVKRLTKFLINVSPF